MKTVAQRLEELQHIARPACTKIPYRTHKEANQSLKNMKKREGRDKTQDCYCCPVCGQWHVTSRSKSQSRRYTRLKKRNGLL